MQCILNYFQTWHVSYFTSLRPVYISDICLPRVGSWFSDWSENSYLYRVTPQGHWPTSKSMRLFCWAILTGLQFTKFIAFRNCGQWGRGIWEGTFNFYLCVDRRSLLNGLPLWIWDKKVTVKCYKYNFKKAILLWN